MTILALFINTLLSNEQGQDLIEYALVVALIAFGAVAAIDQLSGDIFLAFSSIGTKVVSAMAQS